jgi:hypothetical protein
MTTARNADLGPGEQHPMKKYIHFNIFVSIIILLPLINDNITCISIIRPHHPPANTLVIQKLINILQNSVNRRRITHINSITVIKFIKHVGHNSRKTSLFGDVIVHFDRPHSEICRRNENFKQFATFIVKQK